MDIVLVFAAALSVMIASLVGVIFVWGRIGNFIQRNLCYLVSFSAGVFLIVALQLSLEVFEESQSLTSLLWVIGGAIGIYLLFKLLPQFHHHHSKHEKHDESHSTIDARRIIISDGIHNIADGILLAAAFAVSPILGLFTALSVLIHEFLQEVSEFFVLKEAGFSTQKALSVNFLTSSTILIGAIPGIFLLEQFHFLEIPLLGIAAGAFLVVVTHDLIPHSIHSSRATKTHLKHILWFILGAILMGAITLTTAHSHEGEEVHFEDRTEELHHDHAH